MLPKDSKALMMACTRDVIDIDGESLSILKLVAVARYGKHWEITLTFHLTIFQDTKPMYALAASETLGIESTKA